MGGRNRYDTVQRDTLPVGSWAIHPKASPPAGLLHLTLIRMGHQWHPDPCSSWACECGHPTTAARQVPGMVTGPSRHADGGPHPQTSLQRTFKTQSPGTSALLWRQSTRRTCRTRSELASLRSAHSPGQRKACSRRQMRFLRNNEPGREAKHLSASGDSRKVDRVGPAFCCEPLGTFVRDPRGDKEGARADSGSSYRLPTSGFPNPGP